jgi:predicted NBD/HSP70 family sugar kinase
LLSLKETAIIINLKGSNMKSVHELNWSKILQTLFLYAPISRIEIANIMSLTPPTITSNIALLIQAGIVEEISGGGNEGKAAIGRKPIQMNIVPNAYYAIGVDWSPNGIICILTNLRGQVKGRVKAKNEGWKPDTTISKTAALIKGLVKKSGISPDKILGIGVGVPGFIETDMGVVRYSPAHGWQNVAVQQALEAKTGLNVVIENNVRVMAVGKMFFPSAEAGAKSRITGNFLYIFVGRGIACAIVHNNELLRGNVFGAGELGHTTVALNGPVCSCGKRGCLEAIAGEYAITRRAALALRDKAVPGLNIKNPAAPKIGEILAAYDQNDAVIEPVLSECIEYLAVGAANVINLINPKLVIFYGQIFDSPRLRTSLLEKINNHIFLLTQSETAFDFSPYNEDFCAISGSAYAIKHFLL